MTDRHWTPRRLDFPFQSVKIKCVSAGPFHCAAISTLGGLYTWGDGFEGRLGHGNHESRFTPCLVEYFNGELTASCAMAVASWLQREPLPLVAMEQRRPGEQRGCPATEYRKIVPGSCGCKLLADAGRQNLGRQWYRCGKRRDVSSVFLSCICFLTSTTAISPMRMTGIFDVLT